MGSCCIAAITLAQQSERRMRDHARRQAMARLLGRSTSLFVGRQGVAPHF